MRTVHVLEGWAGLVEGLGFHVTSVLAILYCMYREPCMCVNKEDCRSKQGLCHVSAYLVIVDCSLVIGGSSTLSAFPTRKSGRLVGWACTCFVRVQKFQPHPLSGK